MNVNTWNPAGKKNLILDFSDGLFANQSIINQPMDELYQDREEKANDFLILDQKDGVLNKSCQKGQYMLSVRAGAFLIRVGRM